MVQWQLATTGPPSQMNLRPTAFDGLFVAETTYLRDPRGAFGRVFCEAELAPAIGTRHVVQANHSRTAAVGTVRGMHYQRGAHAEMKLVRCLRGRVFDVAVDLRADSPTRFQWHAEELTPENGRMLIIPEGFAHGFQVLEEDSELLYLHTAAYAPHAEGGVAYDDPLLAIRWPLPAVGLSPRDLGYAPLTTHFTDIRT